MYRSVRAALFAGLACTASPALAQKCFWDDGTISMQEPHCYGQGDLSAVADGKPLVYDGYGRPKLIVFTEGKKAQGKPLYGARDPGGRVILPARFSRMKPLSPWLAMGAVPEKGAADRIFLLDLRTGAVRSTPYVDILASYSFSLPGLLLGHIDRTTNDMAILDQAGIETGVQIRNAKLPGNGSHDTLAGGPKTISPGVLQFAGVVVTIEGKEPAGGLPIYHGGGQYGVFADTGRKAPNVTGDAIFGRPALDTLFLPLDSVGQVQPPPKGVLGVVRTESGWYYAREAPGGGVLYQRVAFPRVPDLAAAPIGPQYSALYSLVLVDLGRTPKGWAYAGALNLGTFHAEPKAAAIRITEELKVVAAANAARYKAEREAAEQAERAANTAAIVAQIDRAAAEKWPEGSLGLKFLQDRVLNSSLEDYYRSKGLPMLRFESEACRRGRAGFCTATIARSASSGSSFEWTWQNSFENASKLGARQNAENCAAALKGAARFCTRP